VTRKLDTAPLPWHGDIWQQTLTVFRTGSAGHAYLLHGEAETGKRHFASKLSEYLLCQNPLPDTACGHCKSCLLNAAGNNPDLLMLVPEEGSKQIKVEQVRDVRQFLEMRSHGNGRRIIIIDTAESLGVSSANALLKGLEEPPAEVVFLLLSDRPRAVLSTISSRAQSVRMPKPGRDQVLAWLLTLSARESVSDLEQIIELAQGRPLAAQAIIDSGLAATYDEIGEALLALAQEREYSLNVAGRYSKSHCMEFLTVLLHWLAELSKFRMTASATRLKGKALMQLAQSLTTRDAPEHADGQTLALLQLYNRVATAQMQLVGTGNPNTQLMLEDLLLEFARLFKHFR
jgi:DNA polymerase-3 subunit delta'